MQKILINVNNSKNIFIQVLTLLAPLIGVFLGYFLSYIRKKQEDTKDFKNKKRAIVGELKTNLGILPQKIDLLNKIKFYLKKESILPGSSASFSLTIYKSYIADISYKLDNEERENLYMIYERLDIVDIFLENFFDQFLSTKNSDLFNETIYKDFISECEDMIEHCMVTIHLIENYLKGNPKNIKWDKVPDKQQIKYNRIYFNYHILTYLKKENVSSTINIHKKVLPNISIESTYYLLSQLEQEGKIKKVKECSKKSEIIWEYIRVN